MLSDFVLQQDANFNWQGTTGKKVKIKLVPAPTSIPVTFATVFYPATTAVTPSGDTAEITLVAGAADLSVSIQPRVVPPIVWSVIEVGASGDTQTLTTVNLPSPLADPYSTSIRIIGQGGA